MKKFSKLREFAVAVDENSYHPCRASVVRVQIGSDRPIPVFRLVMSAGAKTLYRIVTFREILNSRASGTYIAREVCARLCAQVLKP